MCLLMTWAAALAAAILWYLLAPASRLNLGLLALMYTGAALMWTVDGFFSLAAGEAFLELTGHDAILGLIIILAGLTAWLLLLLLRDPKRVLPTLLARN